MGVTTKNKREYALKHGIQLTGMPPVTATKGHRKKWEAYSKNFIDNMRGEVIDTQTGVVLEDKTLEPDSWSEHRSPSGGKGNASDFNLGGKKTIFKTQTKLGHILGTVPPYDRRHEVFHRARNMMRISIPHTVQDSFFYNTRKLLKANALFIPEIMYALLFYSWSQHTKISAAEFFKKMDMRWYMSFISRLEFICTILPPMDLEDIQLEEDRLIFYEGSMVQDCNLTVRLQPGNFKKPRQCKQCKKEYLALYGVQTYCSRICSRENERENVRNWTLKTREKAKQQGTSYTCMAGAHQKCRGLKGCKCPCHKEAAP